MVGRLSTNGCNIWLVVHTTAQLHRCILPGRPPECCRLQLYSLLRCGLVNHICSSLLCILFLGRLPFLVLFLHLVHSCCILCIELFVQRALFLCLVLSSRGLVVRSLFLCCFSFLYLFLSFLCLCACSFLFVCWWLLCPSAQLLHCSLLQHWMTRSAGAC